MQGTSQNSIIGNEKLTTIVYKNTQLTE